MVRKGYMIPGKHYLGFILIALAIIYIFKDVGGMAQLISTIEPYKIVVWMLVAVGGYFLVLAER